MKHIKFKIEPYNIDILLKKRITNLCGESATGKSLIYEMLKGYNTMNLNETYVCIDALNMFNIDADSITNKLNKLNNTIIIIDQANHFLNNYKIEQFIRKDYKKENYYILLGRTLGVVSAMSELAEPVIDGNNISIKYLFED